MSTTSIVKWNEEHVRNLISSGRSVPKAYAMAAPKGFIAKLRAERRQSLRSNGHLIIAQLEKQRFELEKFDGTVDPNTRELVANHVRKDGSEVLHLTVVRRALTPAEKENAQLKATNEALMKELEALRLAISGRK